MEEKKLKFERYKFNLGIVKWFVGSIAVVVITIVIDQGFRERTLGLQEMGAYDQYVEVILKADNIEERWTLASYFATVTPTERLRNRWEVYRDTIEKDYLNFKMLEERIFELEKQEEISQLITQDNSEGSGGENTTLLYELHNQIKGYEQQLVSAEKYDKDYNLALSWEAKGFSFLFDKDVINAINAFEKSAKSYDQFHQANEISLYLTENKEQLKGRGSKIWKETFRNMAENYSWKMPDKIKSKFLKLSK